MSLKIDAIVSQNSIFEEKTFSIVLILDGVSSPANIGSIFRLADLEKQQYECCSGHGAMHDMKPQKYCKHLIRNNIFTR